MSAWKLTYNIPFCMQVKTIDRVRREFTSDPEFNPANAAKASSAAEGLCRWIYAMDSYDKVSVCAHGVCVHAMRHARGTHGGVHGVA